ncbi:MAG: hypothetical protein Q8R30_00300 [bacterium]|nr:hypothetical protein [bacterium]
MSVHVVYGDTQQGGFDVIRTITDVLLLMAPLLIVYAIWFTTKNIEEDDKDE